MGFSIYQALTKVKLSLTDGKKRLDHVNGKTRYVILVNDMLNDFIHGKLKSARAAQIIPKISLLLERARQKDIPIFYCNDEHLPKDKYELKLWGEHAMKGTEGARVIDELKPASNDYIVPKRRYSSFDETSLDSLLQNIYSGKGADTIIMTGVHTHICIEHTAYDAFVRGYGIIVAEDGVQAFSAEDHQAGLDYMKQNYGVSLELVSNIIKNIS